MKQTSNPFGRLAARWLATATLSALLAACGGGSASSLDGSRAQGRSAVVDQTKAAEAQPNTDPAEFARSAALSSADLTAAEQQAQVAEVSKSSPPLEELKAGAIAPKSAYQSGAVATKAAAVRIPVYRFFNGSTGAHFFTTSTTERDNVVANLSPPFNLEGDAFSVASAFSPGLSPVHRFYNTQTGVHFYTISETERANVVANLQQFSYEGVAYHASQVAGAGLIPFFRFYVPSKGFHFYTASESEKDSIIANLAATYTYEGIGYYVLDSNWRAEKLPHSGITSSQCAQPGNATLVACDSMNAMNLNPQQDGHRAAINAMNYSAVGNNPLTQCVQDNITGLIWEGKDASGYRAGSNTFTHLGNGATSDASGYVNLSNQLALCGFSNWRLPTAQELGSIVDHGKPVPPLVNIAAFPNTSAIAHWSSQEQSTDAAIAWTLNFRDGAVLPSPRSTLASVRLVRGNAPSGPRFTYSTVAFGSDMANNVVNDAWTGLQWRRCEEGRSWHINNFCTGAISTFNHEQALTRARQQTGWRLPNVKELSSLSDLSVNSGALIDPTAFPTALSTAFWSSSPYTGYVTYASVVASASGTVAYGVRTSGGYAVRLVRDNQ